MHGATKRSCHTCEHVLVRLCMQQRDQRRAKRSEIGQRDQRRAKAKATRARQRVREREEEGEEAEEVPPGVGADPPELPVEPGGGGEEEEVGVGEGAGGGGGGDDPPELPPGGGGGGEGLTPGNCVQVESAEKSMVVRTRELCTLYVVWEEGAAPFLMASDSELEPVAQVLSPESAATRSRSNSARRTPLVLDTRTLVLELASSEGRDVPEVLVSRRMPDEAPERTIAT